MLNTPLRSRLGNVVGRYLFKRRFRVNLKDTQTGLRGIPLQLAKELVKLETDRYDFEMECLILANTLNYELYPVGIETVYDAGNSSSHFSLIIDSIKIINVLYKTRTKAMNFR